MWSQFLLLFMCASIFLFSCLDAILWLYLICYVWISCHCCPLTHSPLTLFATYDFLLIRKPLVMIGRIFRSWADDDEKDDLLSIIARFSTSWMDILFFLLITPLRMSSTFTLTCLIVMVMIITDIN